MTPRFHCSRHGLDPWLGRSHMAWSRPDQSTPVYFSSFISGCGALDWVLMCVYLFSGLPAIICCLLGLLFIRNLFSLPSKSLLWSKESPMPGLPLPLWPPPSLSSLKRLLERPAFRAWKEQGSIPEPIQALCPPQKGKQEPGRPQIQTVGSSSGREGGFPGWQWEASRGRMRIGADMAPRCFLSRWNGWNTWACGKEV